MEVSNSSKPMNISSGASPRDVDREGMKGGNVTSLRSFDFIVLRFLAFVTSLIAAILMGVSKQTTMVPVVFIPNLPPVPIQAVAKWQDLSAFRFFLAANIIACIYAALSLVLSIFIRSSSKGFGSMIFILDLIVVNLLFSGIGATGAVGLLGYQGNEKVRWNKVCNVFDTFCRYNTVSTVISLIGATMFVFILVLFISKNNKSRC